MVSGREHEFVGLGLIAGGVLIGLAIYFKLAGVLGKAVDRALGWLCGLGRFAIPVVLVGGGIALIRQGRSDRRVRLVVGCGVLSVSVLAMLHVFIVSVPSPDNRWYQLGPLGGAGGWIGALVAVPARSLIGNVASVVIFLALAFAAVLLITGMSTGALLTRSKDSVGAFTLPVGRAARRALGGMSTLSSDRADRRDRVAQDADHDAFPSPQIYDVEDEEADEPAPRRASKKVSAASSSDPLLAVPGEQGELDLGPGAKKGQWVLPPASLLIRSGVQTDRKSVV